jgi:hypothetical protein
VDQVIDDLSLDDALSLVLMPFLVEVGDRWAAGQLSVTQEHFASHLVRSRSARRELRRIAASHPVAIAGAGASRDLADDLGARWFAGDVTDGARAAVDVLREPAG